VPDAGPEAPLGYADAWQVEIPSPCDPAVKFNPAHPKPGADRDHRGHPERRIEFLPQFGNPDELIMWPHVNVNTLRKQ
jgi:hypothetical protein